MLCQNPQRILVRVHFGFAVFAIAFIIVTPILLASVSGCGDPAQQEYVWTRPGPAMGRRLPTTFVVRISIDRQNKSVVWFEDVRDGDDNIDQSTKTWNSCEFLDDSNWHCEAGAVFGQGIPNDIEMRDGKLVQRYWGEVRDFQLRRKIFDFLAQPLKGLNRRTSSRRSKGRFRKRPNRPLSRFWLREARDFRPERVVSYCRILWLR